MKLIIKLEVDMIQKPAPARIRHQTGRCSSKGSTSGVIIFFSTLRNIEVKPYRKL